MKLIDAIQQLGVGHHFEKEIRLLLEGFLDYNSNEGLYDAALRFRLLRHNGLPTSSGIGLKLYRLIRVYCFLIVIIKLYFLLDLIDDYKILTLLYHLKTETQIIMWHMCSISL